jgi:hypothetical protein
MYLFYIHFKFLYTVYRPVMVQKKLKRVAYMKMHSCVRGISLFVYSILEAQGVTFIMLKGLMALVYLCSESKGNINRSQVEFIVFCVLLLPFCLHVHNLRPQLYDPFCL